MLLISQKLHLLLRHLFVLHLSTASLRFLVRLPLAPNVEKPSHKQKAFYIMVARALLCDVTVISSN